MWNCFYEYKGLKIVELMNGGFDEEKNRHLTFTQLKPYKDEHIIEEESLTEEEKAIFEEFKKIYYESYIKAMRYVLF